MYKYTASKKIMKGLLKIRKSGYKPNAEWDYLSAYFPFKNNYTEVMTLGKYYEKSVFFSPSPMKEIPVMGCMFPVNMFDVEHIT